MSEKSNSESSFTEKCGSKSIFRKLLSLRQTFNKQNSFAQLGKSVDEIVRKNNLLADQLQEQINLLDVESFPSTTLPARYRWRRLVKDLDALNERLLHLRHLLQHDRVRTAMNMFTYDIWPLTLKISSRHQIETGREGDWINDITALYLLSEKFSDEAELAGRVTGAELSIAAPRVHLNNVRLVLVNSAIDEDFDNDSNNKDGCRENDSRRVS